MTRHDKHHISDELLNSYIDHQITHEERQDIKQQINHDKDLAKRVHEIQQLKQLTQLAYDDIPGSRLPDTVITEENYWPRIAAAVAIFTLGLLVGNTGILQSQEIRVDQQLNVSATTQSSPAKSVMSANKSDSALTKVLVHLTSSDIDSGLNTLNNLEQLLLDYQRKNQAVRVEVVANGKGIKLLRPDMHQIAERIASLSNQYDNVSFAACKNTIDQIELTEGRLVDLIPQVKLIESGVVEVIRRQQDGWTYIRG